MPNEVRWTAGGLDAIHAALRGSTGYMAGFAGLLPANTDTGSGMRRLFGAQTAPIPIPTPNIKPILGDDGVYDNYMFASADPNQGILELGEQDNTLVNTAEGTTSAAVGVYTFFGRGGSIANPKNMQYLLTRQAHAMDSGSASAGYENELVFNALTKAIFDESKAHQQEGKQRLQVTFNESPTTFWGKLASEVFGVAKRQSVAWFSQYRSAIHCYIADGTETETTPLDYVPLDATTTKAWNFGSSTLLTVSSVNTTTKTVTLSAAPASGSIIVILYQTLTF